MIPLIVNRATRFVYFGFDLKVKGIGTDGDYDLMAECLSDKGLISHRPDKAYFESLAHEIRYWDGEKWQGAQEWSWNESD